MYTFNYITNAIAKEGGCMARREEGKVNQEKHSRNGVYKDKEVVPKEGTKLTPERIGRHYRSLNPEREEQAGT